jgi:hypothetical protein
MQFVIPVCPNQLVISEADPTQGALLFLLLSHQQAPSGPALQDSTTSAPYRAPLPLVGSFLTCVRHSFISQAHCGSLVLIVSVHAFCIGSQVLYGSLVLLHLSMLSALDHKSSMGRLFGCICPCF